MLYKSNVFFGEQIGRTLDFPTVNLNASLIPKNTKQGVYASWVTHNNVIYKGALYFGPRLVFNEKNTVLEIYIIDFNKEIYNQEISFTLESYIRPPLDFDTLEALKQQLKKDISDVMSSLHFTA